MSFIERAVEVVEHGVGAGEELLSEHAAHRHAARLFLKLGIAVFAEQRLDGTHEPVDRILKALDGHAAEHGEVDIDHLKAAHEVLGDEFVSAHAAS
ncbi:hypothetical protein ABH931_005386 [Streptacidiphilus sp. MAP12-33]|uniref:hypothetical protein n=1 Tax=Streptacidiphilus sp. MAP12-33 TaxID=3156266 RepID=UPI003511D0E0